MGKVLFLQNAPLFTGGTFEAELTRREISFEYHKVFESGLPSLEQIRNYAGFIVLGGPLKFRVDQAQKSPVLSKEISYLRACLDQHKPVFAVGQGSNLLAQAQGAWVERIQRREIAWVQAEVYPDYSRNSVVYSKVEGRKFPVFAWYDTVNGFPPQGYWYLTTPNCRYLSSGIHGNCYLFNFHPEITLELVQSWLKEYGKELESKEAAQKIIEQTQEHLESTQALSKKIIHAFESFLK
jgi:GMP synthase-like glutamine amidotransferase